MIQRIALNNETSGTKGHWPKMEIEQVARRPKGTTKGHRMRPLSKKKRAKGGLRQGI